MKKIHKFLVGNTMDNIMLFIVVGGCLLPFFIN